MLNLLSLLNAKSPNAQRMASPIIYVLKDTFTTAVAAGSVNGTTAEPTGQTRTVTDTNSKISITGGQLSFATGEAANDGVWYPSVTRVAGKILLGTINTTGILSANFGWFANQNSTSIENLRFRSGLQLSVVKTTTDIVVGSYTGSTNYRCAIVMKSSGQYFFIKGGTEYPNWTLLFSFTNLSSAMFPGTYTTGTTVVYVGDDFRVPSNLYLPIPLAYDTFTRSNGAIGSTETVGPDSQNTPSLAWAGSTYTISSNAAINTPNLGSELVTNGAFSTDTSGWTANGSTLASVAGGATGNGLQVTNSGAAAGYAFQSFTTVIGQTYQVSINYKNGTGGLGGTLKVGTAQNGSQNYSKGLSTASFSQRTGIFRATATTTFVTLINISTVSGDTTLFDDVSVKPYTTSELFASLATSTKDVIADVNLPSTASLAGLVINLDSASNPRNFILAYIDTINSATALLIKGVDDGTNIIYTTIISATVTFVAGATLRVIKDGTGYQLFYNNLKVGSTSTISDAAIVSNTIHGLYSTVATSATLNNFQLFPRGATANEYSALDNY